MRARPLLTLLIGLLLAGVAVYYVDQRLNERESVRVVAAEPAMPLAMVVVAGRDLARGDLLRADVLREIEWPTVANPRARCRSSSRWWTS